jgi:hypothetical protein
MPVRLVQFLEARGIGFAQVPPEEFDSMGCNVLAIAPRHVVMAKHYARPAAAPVVFHDRSGKRIQRKLIGFSAAAGDVMVGLLDEPV